MPHLLFLYLIMVYTAGFAALVIISYAYARSRDRLVLSYLVFYAAFTLMVVCAGVNVYLQVTSAGEETVRAVDRITVWTTLFFSCTIVSLMTRFFPLRRLRPVQWVFFTAALGLLILSAFPAGQTSHPAYALLAAASLYSLVLSIVSVKKAQVRERKFAWIMIVGLAVFTPLIFIPIFLQDAHAAGPGRIPAQLITFPLFYCYQGALFTRYFLRNHGPEAAAGDVSLPPGAFGLSEREREVIVLVATGESNKAIAEKLFISVPTVKKHLHNVFGKMGIRTRYQLIRKISGG